MARVKTFTNGGFIFPADLNAIEDDYETQFASYDWVLPGIEDLLSFGGGSGLSGHTYILGSQAAPAPDAGVAGNTGGLAAFYLDPADLTANTRTNKYRLRVSLLTNTIAPLSTFTFGLYPVTGAAGGAGANTITLGAVTAGSTVTFAAPAASSTNQGNSGDFAAPAAGYYALAVAYTVANQATNGSVVARLALQARQV